MRYNAEIQKAADAYAKKHGYFCAVYLGPTDKALIFKPRWEDNEPRCTGLPTFIVYRDNKFRLDRGLNFCKYDKKLRYKHQPSKGKALFDIYNQMSDYDFAASEEDLSLVKEIVAASWGGGYETPVPMHDICEALEIADRLDMTIEFFPNPATMERCDGWEYFIRIIPGKLPEKMKIIID